MTQTIEQLQAKIAELEADLEFQTNARIQDRKDAETNYKNWNAELKKQLAAEQLNNKLLRDALQSYIDEHEECQDADDWMAMMCSIEAHHTADEALSQPSDTSALDSFVAEKVTRPNFSQMREMLRAMQAGELTVSRGIEIIDIWHAGNWNDDMLPPVRQDLIEEDSTPVEIIDRLTRQRDLAVEALKSCGVNDGLKGPTQYFDEDLVERAIKESGAK